MRGDQGGEEAPESSRNASPYGHSQERPHGLRGLKGTWRARRGWQAGPGRVPAEAESAGRRMGPLGHV